MDLNKKTAVVLVNVGTPEAPEPAAVGRYLNEFLMDERVITLPTLFRWFLVHFLIVPKRKHLSAESYRKIWTPAGSPLLVYSRELAHKAQAALSEEFQVELAMRYGEPSIKSVFAKLAKDTADGTVGRVLVLPLFPQYAEVTSLSGEEECRKWYTHYRMQAPLEFVQPFFAETAFLKPSISIIDATLKEKKPDHVLFSFHGLPEKQLRGADRSGQHCLIRKDCCWELRSVNRKCYRAQCYQTARSLAEGARLGKNFYSVSFQSRLGRSAWIQPYTDDTLAQLARDGVRKLAVVCPSFTTDCLETLEEIGDRGREIFRQAGGEELILVECLNVHPQWIQGVAELVRLELARIEKLKGGAGPGRSKERAASREKARGAKDQPPA